MSGIGKFVQVIRGVGRKLVEYDIDSMENISETPLIKDEVTGQYGRMVGEKFVPVEGSVKTVYQQPGVESPGGHGWQERKDIR